jgi:hypothetical protein
MRLLSILTLLSCAAVADTNSAAFPPLPVSSTNAISNISTNDGWSEAFRIEFAPVCHQCGHTNHYAMVLSTNGIPLLQFDIPMETSTNLVDWTATNLTQRILPTDDARFYRLPRRATVEGK